MGEVFNTHAEGLARIPSKLLVGIGIEKASHAEPDLAVLYADVGKRFGLEAFQNDGGFCLDVGIAEQNLIGVAAGMSHEGFLPVAITYAPFLSGRVFDQIKANIGQMGLPMVLMGATSGFAGGDLGPLLMCTDDMAMLRTIPNLTIVCPADGIETVRCIVSAVQQKESFYIRLTGGKKLTPVYTEDYSFQIGKAIELREGNQVAVIGTGAILTEVLSAADRLCAEGKPVTVLNMHTVKPLDTEALDRYMDRAYFVTVEEHSVFGGLGSAVGEYLAEKGKGPALVRLGAPDRYFLADHYENLLQEAGLTANQIYETLKRFV